MNQKKTIRKDVNKYFLVLKCNLSLSLNKKLWTILMTLAIEAAFCLFVFSMFNKLIENDDD